MARTPVASSEDRLRSVLAIEPVLDRLETRFGFSTSGGCSRRPRKVKFLTDPKRHMPPQQIETGFPEHAPKVAVYALFGVIGRTT